MGSARDSRAGFGVSPKQSFPAFGNLRGLLLQKKFAMARHHRQARETRALPGRTNPFGDALRFLLEGRLAIADGETFKNIFAQKRKDSAEAFVLRDMH